MTIFDETYRVVAVESQSLVICGVLSGQVLIINTDAEFPLTEEAFPIGKLIVLSDPSTAPPN
jgi:hypothetical protein